MPSFSRAGSVLSAILAVLLASPALAVTPDPADFILYHAEADDGVRPVITPTLPTGGGSTLHLYMAALSGTAVDSAPGEACLSGMGDERCGYDVALEITGAGNIVSFVPEPGVIFSLTSSRLRFNGGDFESGEIGVVKVGDLVLNATGDAEVGVVDGTLVSARLVGRPISGRTVVYVPEPSGLWALCAGAFLLAGLQRRRKRTNRIATTVAVWAIATSMGLLAAEPASAQWRLGINVDTIRVSGDSVYASSKCASEFASPLSQIQRSAANTPDGDPMTLIFDPPTCDSDRVVSTNIGIDSGDVYWVNSVGEVVKWEYGATSISLVASTAGTPTNGSSSIDVDGVWVYWHEGSTIYRALQSGAGSRSTVTTLASAVSDLRTIGYRDLLYLQGGFLRRLTFLSGFGWLPSTLGPATAYAFDDNDIFWADPTGASGAVLIRAALDGGPATTLVTVPGAGAPSVDAMAANADYVFYQPIELGVGPIARVAHNGTDSGSITTASQGMGAGQMDASRSHVFWSADLTSINRVRGDAVIIAENLEALAMEVVQIVQRPANDVRLVADKVTHLRFWGRIESSSIGRTTARVSPPAVLRGFRGGLELAESPLYPRSGRTPFTTSTVTDRNNIDGQIYFRLPDTWTEAGDIELRGIINPLRTFIETDYVSDNEISQTLTFQSKASICGLVIPVQTVVGTYGGYRARDANTWRRAQSLLPTHDLRLFWRGGDPIEEWNDPLGIGRGPFELSRADNDSGRLIFRMVISEPFRGTPQVCRDENAKKHLVAFVPPGLPDRAANGLALGDSTLTWLKYGLDPSGSEQNRWVAGVTLAHELGHNDGRNHVDCAPGDPSGTDSSYPWPNPCVIDTNPTSGYTGFDPMTVLPLQGTQTSDLMGYGHRRSPPRVRWTSAYTWDAIFDDLNDRPVAMMSTAMGEPAGAAMASALPMQVVGLIDPTRPVAHLAPATPMDSDAVDAFVDLYGAITPHPTLVLRVFDEMGVLTEENPVLIREEAELGEDEGDIFVSFTGGPGPHGRVELIDLANAGKPYGVLTGSASTPTVSIDAPLSGLIASGSFNVEWTANDADGDTLYHNVRFSADLGASWEPVLWQSNKTQIDLATKGIKTCTSTCLIEVTTSDGLHATTVVSAPFTALADPLDISVSVEREGAPTTGTFAVIPQSDSVLLTGYAYSDDDGPLRGAALQWTVGGPESRNGSGRRLSLDGLTPGTYSASLTATDTAAQVNSAVAGFIVEPKEIPTGGAPSLDGDCNDLAYEADKDLARIRYFGPESAMAQTVHSGNTTYVCLSGLDPTTALPGVAGVAFDLDSSGGIFPQTGDVEFRVDRDGVATYGVGDGSVNFQAAPVPLGFSAAVQKGDTTWGAELAIDDSLLGGFAGRVTGQFFHRWIGPLSFPVQVSWPNASLMEKPDGWGEIEFGTPLRIVIDADIVHDPNYVDPALKGIAHYIVVFATPEFDPVNDFDFAVSSFGPSGATPVGAFASDQNGDQLDDLVLAYWIETIGASANDVELCLVGNLVPAAGGASVAACDEVVTECAPEQCDFDGDGITDELDGCSLLADDGTDSGGLLTTKSNGKPDACECGDWRPDGVLDALDIADMRDFLAEVPGASVPMATCDVDDDGLCDIVDVTIMSRAQLNLGPGLGEACGAAQIP